MRLEDIKFKAKSLINGEWFIGSLINGPGDNAYIADRFESVVEVDPTTVCQYTGLKDKDGREIWEHDLLRYKFPDAFDKAVLYKVVWNPKIASFVVNYAKCNEYMTSPLGNTLSNISLRVVGNEFDKEGSL